jgi:hypothetical protein
MCALTLLVLGGAVVRNLHVVNVSVNCCAGVGFGRRSTAGTYTHRCEARQYEFDRSADRMLFRAASIAERAMCLVLALTHHSCTTSHNRHRRRKHGAVTQSCGG